MRLHSSIAFRTLLLTMRGTLFLLRDSCPGGGSEVCRTVRRRVLSWDQQPRPPETVRDRLQCMGRLWDLTARFSFWSTPPTPTPSFCPLKKLHIASLSLPFPLTAMGMVTEFAPHCDVLGGAGVGGGCYPHCGKQRGIYKSLQ